MSIWSYMTDLERKSLGDLKQAAVEAEVDLCKIETAAIDAENELAKAKRSVKDYQAQVVTRAISGNAEPAPEPKPSIADLELLITGLDTRQEEQEHAIKTATSHYEAERARVLGECIERASVVYRQRACDLIESWHELNEGQMAVGERDLSWMHIFIPAIEGMKGRQTHHELATLFTGKDLPIVDGGVVMAELERLLA